MDKNYYEQLQVNQNASPEIIEKAYKILAKKYHPDLQPEENKKQAEELLKKINEAYEVLSNPEKKKCYDASLAEKKETKNSGSSDTINISKENFALWQQQELQRKQQMQYQMQQLQQEQELAYLKQLEQARKKAYHDAYIQDLKNRGYKIRYKKSLKDHVTSFITLMVILLFFFLLWQIPFIRNFLINFYESNPLLQCFHFIVIGNSLKLSPCFPLLHTVLDSFPSYGVPSIYLLLLHI